MADTTDGTADGAISTEPVEEDKDKVTKGELTAAIVLGFAAVLTAFAAYRGALTDDLVLKNYVESQAAITQGNDYYSSGYQTASFEQSTFLQYATELLGGNEDGANYVLTLMSPSQQALIEEWSADEREDTISPFSDEYEAFFELDSQYDFRTGDELYDDAETSRKAAEDADTNSDIYELSQVFFAVTLFVAGIAVLLRSPKVQAGVLVLGISMLLAGSVVLVMAETA